MSKEPWEYVAFYDGALAVDMAPRRQVNWKDDPQRVCVCGARKNWRLEKCRPCLSVESDG